MTQIDDKLLNAIAEALSLAPRSSLQALAKAAGISRATLYRIAPTREDVVALLESRSIAVVQKAIEEADFEAGDPIQALSVVTQTYLDYRHMYSFVIHHMTQVGIEAGSAHVDPPEWRFYDEAMEKLFLRGQRLGLIRIDQPASWLNELHAAIVYGATRAIGLGRLAPASAHAYIMSSFLDGAAGRDHNRIGALA